MKKSIRTLIFFLLLIISIGCQTDEECQQPPCVRPNINQIIELTLVFQNFQTGEQVELVRLNKSDKSTIDTLQLELDANNEIRIGGGGIVGFTESTTGDTFEEATLDFKILYLDEPINNISNIEIQTILPDCGCANYRISTLQLDGETIEVNSEHYSLNL